MAEVGIETVQATGETPIRKCHTSATKLC